MKLFEKAMVTSAYGVAPAARSGRGLKHGWSMELVPRGLVAPAARSGRGLKPSNMTT